MADQSPFTTMLENLEEPSQKVADDFTEQQAEKLGEEYDKYDKPVTAAAAGFARGAVPFSDVILTKGLGVDPNTLEKLKEVNPVASTTGEIAGFTAGALSPSGVAKATVGGAAIAAEKAIAKVLSKSFANKAEKTIARKIIEKGAIDFTAGAIPGAALGVNELANEAALGNLELTAENVVAHAGVGAILNGVATGVFGAAKASVPSVKSGIDKVTGQVKRATKEAGDPLRNFSELFSTGAKQAKDTFDTLSSRGIVADDLARFADQQMNLKLTDSAQTIYEKYVASSKKIMDGLDNAYKNFDTAIEKKAVQSDVLHNELRDTLSNFAKQNIEKLDAAGHRRVLQQIRNEIQYRDTRRLYEKLGPSFESMEELRKLKQKFGDLGWAKGPTAEASFKEEAYRTMHNKVSEILDGVVESAISGKPELSGIANELKQLNKDAYISQTIKKGVGSKAAAKSSLIDFRDAVLSGIGLAAGEPTVAAGLVGARKLLESDLRRKFVVLNGGFKANQESTKKLANIAEKFSTVLKKTAAPTAAASRAAFLNSGFALTFSPNKKPKAPETKQEAFENIRENLSQFKADPEKLAVKIAASTMNAGYAAPQVAEFTRVTLATAVEFLHSKIPYNINAESDPFNPNKFKPSDADMAKFARYVQAVEHPFSVLDDIANGTATREHAEALRVVYPALYMELQTTVMNSIKQGAQIPYQRRIQLGVLLDIPTDFSMRPAITLGLQSNFQPTQTEETGAVKSTVTGMQSLKKSNRLASDVQANQMNEE